MCSSPLSAAAAPPATQAARPRDRARPVGEAIRIGEVGEVLAGTGALLVAQHAHRRRAAGRVAREQVSAAGATAAAGRRRRSGAAPARPRPFRGSRPPSVRSPSRTSGMRACRRCCPAEAPPGSRRSGRRDRIPRERFGACPAPSQRAIVGTCPSRSAGAGRARRGRRSRTGSRRVRRCGRRRTFRARRRTRRRSASSSMLSAGRAASGRPRA